ncbi:MazG nucleotide pyrophosphohydrolase domain-containing protein [Falsibacillus pallidus]|uniref:NTP pyrophosphatase (Non-canonical NTP hydrolase) n=1 Tax=Falsibacillus pallidus TaxID=493781 RepID=A0A370G2T2_9BACI|nr:MazG nucleotide pyrophosphohydrolase domain-containing protein [Falsibacillus pallidus]RDI38012.1 NTP pyrophosphatase (non-canonical NTP hydrolase) [Falsibacillus pallidus]
MEPLNLAILQEYLGMKYKDCRSSTDLFMKLVEEVGEVAEVLNQMDGRKSDSGSSSLEKELADVIHYTVAIASINNIDSSKVIVEKDKIAAIKYKQSPNLVEFLKKQ